MAKELTAYVIFGENTGEQLQLSVGNAPVIFRAVIGPFAFCIAEFDVEKVFEATIQELNRLGGKHEAVMQSAQPKNTTAH